MFPDHIVAVIRQIQEANTTKRLIVERQKFATIKKHMLENSASVTPSHYISNNHQG